MYDKSAIEGGRGEGLTAWRDAVAEYGGPAFPRSDRIMVGSGDENVAKIQLAARWAEAFADEAEDSLDAISSDSPCLRLHRLGPHSVAPDEP